MPVTTVNIPKDLLTFLESLIRRRIVRSKQDVVVKALQKYRQLYMYEWYDSMILIRGFREAFLTQRSVQQLVKDMPDDRIHQAGKRMGETLKDICTSVHSLDSTKKETWQTALDLLQGIGWGRFLIQSRRILVQYPFLPRPLLHGYLETALGVKLRYVPTTEDVAIFEFGKQNV